MWTYRAIRWLLRAATQVFFRAIHLVGREHIPAEGEGAVVFAGNHPNSLLDPVMVVTTSGRVVHFAAMDKLFSPPLGVVLGALGAVPIMRAMDHGSSGSRDNSGALAALKQVLLDGRAMGIFPEGLSHDGAHLQQLRSGAARIALQTAAEQGPGTVQVVPVGLTYKHRKRFRSRVLVQYGAPLRLTADDVEAHHADSRAAATALTERIEAGIRELTVNAPDWDTLRVLDAVRRMYQPLRIAMSDRVELARRFCEGHTRLRDEPEIAELYADVQCWLDDLDDAGLEDRDVVRGLNRAELFFRGVSNVLRLLIWLPLALPGAPIHAPLLGVVHWAGVRFSVRKDAIGTTRMMLGLVAVLGLYIGLPLLTWWFANGVAAAAVAAMLPATGFAAVKTLERGASLRRIGRTAWASLSLGERLTDLSARRAALEERIVAAVERFIPDDMEPLFPR